MAEQFLWTPASGGEPIDLTDEGAGYSVLAGGTQGLRSVTYRFATQQYAGIDGETVQSISAAANTPSLGLLLQADSESQLRQRLRGLINAMRPKAGPGTLTVTTEEGESRYLSCYLQAGLEGDQATDTHLVGSWWKAVLKFYAPDPWWRGEEVTVDFGLAAPSVFLSATLAFPRMLSASTIQGQQDIDLSDADDDCYPVWTVTGPGSSLTLTNNTTGRTIQLSTPIGDGQTVVIDTRPGYQSVRAGDGTNLMGALSSDPSLWPLEPTVNDVSAVLGSAGAASRIECVVEPRYAGV